jgi:D-amino-acid oxidase
VVNCTGIAAHDLADDQDLYPIRGQLVVLANPGITDFFSEDTGDSPDLLCIYPHGDTVVLGGTAEPHHWRLDPDTRTADAIVLRCAAITPRLATAPVIAHRVGLRPTRPTIRLDEQPHRTGTRIIHSYGHGGAGVSLSWGCAYETAVRLTAPP